MFPKSCARPSHPHLLHVALVAHNVGEGGQRHGQVLFEVLLHEVQAVRDGLLPHYRYVAEIGAVAIDFAAEGGRGNA